MTQDVVITIRISLPEGARVGVTEAATAPRTAVEAPSLPDEPPFPGMDVMAAARKEFSLSPQCPTHGAMHLVPAGVSTRNGRPYKAFWGCVQGCSEKRDA